MAHRGTKPYSPRGSVFGDSPNNWRQALPLLVRPRFLPGNQKGPDLRVIRWWGAPHFLTMRKMKRTYYGCEKHIEIQTPPITAAAGNRGRLNRGVSPKSAKPKLQSHNWGPRQNHSLAANNRANATTTGNNPLARSNPVNPAD